METLPIIITFAGCAIVLLISAVAFFVILFIKDVKQHSIDIAKLHTVTATNKQEFSGDIELLTKTTTLEIQQVNRNVGELTKLVEKIFEHTVNK